MVDYADDDDIGRSGVYADLLAREEEKFARHGGRLTLVRDETVTQQRPGPVLAALRAGQPVEVMDWMLPRWARSGRVKNIRACVHPDGRMVEVD
jgi:hypothetical protein